MGKPKNVNPESHAAALDQACSICALNTEGRGETERRHSFRDSRDIDFALSKFSAQVRVYPELERCQGDSFRFDEKIVWFLCVSAFVVPTNCGVQILWKLLWKDFLGFEHHFALKSKHELWYTRGVIVFDTKGKWGTMRYPVRNLLGQQLQTTPYTQAQRQQLPCPDLPKSPMNCVQTADGGIICEDGTYFPAGCSAPPLTEAGLAPYVQDGSFYFPQPPPKRSLTEETGDKFPILPLVIAGVSLVSTIVFS